MPGQNISIYAGRGARPFWGMAPKAGRAPRPSKCPKRTRGNKWGAHAKTHAAQQSTGTMQRHANMRSHGPDIGHPTTSKGNAAINREKCNELATETMRAGEGLAHNSAHDNAQTRPTKKCPAPTAHCVGQPVNTHPARPQRTIPEPTRSQEG